MVMPQSIETLAPGADLGFWIGGGGAHVRGEYTGSAILS